MKKLKYSPEARDKRQYIKRYLLKEYGVEVAKRVTKNMTNDIGNLILFNGMQGTDIGAMYEIETDYRYILTEHNYVIYRIEQDVIRVINIYNEKEDFIMKLFGITTFSDESEEY